MRSLLVSLTGLVLLVSAIGCNHTCGVCDCAPYTPCAGGNCVGGAPHIAPTVQAEPLKVMPKGGAKE